jgi:AAA+ ATPase superfamily predicted ATPase
MKRFVDREDELSRLRDCYASDDADMVVIFGRRRLGKTELVRASRAARAF